MCLLSLGGHGVPLTVRDTPCKWRIHIEAACCILANVRRVALPVMPSTLSPGL